MQLVIAAITTWPWSRSKAVPSASRTDTRLVGRPLAPAGSGSNQPAGAASWLGSSVVPAIAAGGSLAGNDSSDASSGPAWG